MSPIKWPEVGKVAPHYLEHGIILLDEAAKLQAMARQKPIPMNVISPFIDSLTEYVRKTREQPTMQELLMEIRNGFKETRDIHEKVTIIKQGWDTTRPVGSLPLNPSSGIRSWAQIAATSPGTATLPSLGSLRTSTLPKTASRHLDREIKVKVRDSHSIQVLRRLTEKDIKERIAQALRADSTTTNLASQVTAAKQLKSGDIIIYTSTIEGAEALKGKREWLSVLGTKAEVLEETYGVLVHGVPVNRVNVNNQAQVIEQIKMENSCIIKENPEVQATSRNFQFNAEELPRLVPQTQPSQELSGQPTNKRQRTPTWKVVEGTYPKRRSVATTKRSNKRVALGSADPNDPSGPSMDWLPQTSVGKDTPNAIQEGQENITPSATQSDMIISRAVMAPLLRNPAVLELDIIAIQEPWRNPYQNTTHNPAADYFHLVYMDSQNTRTCFLINKKIPTTAWTARTHSPDVCSLRIDVGNDDLTQPQYIHIHNIYNPIQGLRGYGEALPLLRRELNNALGEEHLVLGDFNARHSLWTGREEYHIGRRDFEELLDILEEYRLDLLLPPGTCTWQSRGQETTLDLVFATEGVGQRMIECKVQPSFDFDSDHFPVSTILDIHIGQEPTTPRRLWRETNIQTLRAALEREMPIAPSAGDPQEIDNLTNTIVRSINNAIDQSTPWSRPSPRSVTGFTKECKEAQMEARRLRRIAKRVQTEELWEQYRRARNRKARLIDKALKAAHRERVETAAESIEGLWKVANGPIIARRGRRTSHR
ncbi:reverse transcriptase protein [Rutstroemia sp. NJR-2017a WRK4]|nr:reverse transcriptase protein [Rutstroemia sp. NJR-2017a WRK4]